MIETPEKGKPKFLMKALLPLFLLAILLLTFVKFGPLGVFKSNIAPIENIFIQRVVFSPNHITLEVFNDGPEPVTIAQAIVNDAYWQFEMHPSKTLNPLDKGKVEISYPWLEGDAQKIGLISRNGITFDKEIDAAMVTPVFNWHYFKTFIILVSACITGFHFILLGDYIFIIPFS